MKEEGNTEIQTRRRGIPWQHPFPIRAQVGIIVCSLIGIGLPEIADIEVAIDADDFDFDERDRAEFCPQFSLCSCSLTTGEIEAAVLEIHCRAEELVCQRNTVRTDDANAGVGHVVSRSGLAFCRSPAGPPHARGCSMILRCPCGGTQRCNGFWVASLGSAQPAPDHDIHETRNFVAGFVTIHTLREETIVFGFGMTDMGQHG